MKEEDLGSIVFLLFLIGYIVLMVGWYRSDEKRKKEFRESILTTEQGIQIKIKEGKK